LFEIIFPSSRRTCKKKFLRYSNLLTFILISALRLELFNNSDSRRSTSKDSFLKIFLEAKLLKFKLLEK